MTDTELETQRYPTGKFSARESAYTSEEIQHFISRIAGLPAKVEAAISGFKAAQLDTPYREGGWTVRQVVHHIPESHMNAYIRFKWTLTEETPTIKAYDEKGWSQTPEVLHADPMISLALLKALHVKWAVLLKSLGTADLNKEYFHPDTGRYNRLDNVIGMYAWHGEHHLAQIVALKKRMGW